MVNFARFSRKMVYLSFKNKPKTDYGGSGAGHKRIN